MEVIIRENLEQCCAYAAKMMEHRVREKPAAVLGLATGSTPLMLYRELIRMHREEGLDFSQCTTFNLDEYVGLAHDHPRSYHHYMNESFFAHINIDRGKTYIPDGTAAQLRDYCRHYEEMIRAAGGIDLQILGIGGNGHIGFNEPTGSLNSRTWVKILSRRTMQDNAQHFDRPEDMPRHVITMGIGTILEARHCLLLAGGEKKANAIKEMIEGPLSAMYPASALQQHPRVTVLIDEEAAQGLTYYEHYKWIDENKLDWQLYS